MLKNKVIINASPLIVTVKSGLGFLWEKLFERIIIPEVVYDEIAMGVGRDEVKKWLDLAVNIQRKEIAIAPEIVSWNLGKGETAVISYCFYNSEYTAIVDDLAAKKCCFTHKLSVLGTGSIIIEAKNQKLISSVKKTLYQLKENGMWISDEVISMLSNRAGEK
ncbi:MAG: DUF3368 domain-containing protein [Leptospiraceae bacterium]|nr:DUF3368 domain-containing protein [Leptospiraceae bacterium]MCP5500416.1 DUF3368 domain-containing protein [Leptospiraceae bacterium]